MLPKRIAKSTKEFSMFLRLCLLLTLIAAPVLAAEEVPPAQDMGNPIFQTILMILMIFAVFYFLLIRPQQRQQKEHEQRINALSKGDRIVTAGGIFGTIIGMKDDIAVVKIAENTKIEIQKSSISRIIGKEE
jgi:preprotein translocase subunit YajC